MPSAAPSYFPESHWWSEISSLSKVILVLGRASSCRAPNLGCRGAESPGLFDVSQNNSAPDVTHEWVLSWWSCQSPVAHSCGLLNHPSSFCGGMYKLDEKFDADSLLSLFSHFECDGHTVPMLTQWCLPPPLTSAVKSLFSNVLSSPLPLAARLHRCCTHCSGYIDNGWTFSRETFVQQEIWLPSLEILGFWEREINQQLQSVEYLKDIRTLKGTVLQSIWKRPWLV